MGLCTSLELTYDGSILDGGKVVSSDKTVPVEDIIRNLMIEFSGHPETRARIAHLPTEGVTTLPNGEFVAGNLLTEIFSLSKRYKLPMTPELEKFLETYRE